MKKPLLWLLVILVIASFFRLYNLPQTPPGLYPDEAMNGNNALEALHTGEYKIFYPENNGREGLFINIQAAWFGLLESQNISPTEPWALRFPSAIFGILTVLGLYLLTREIFKDHPHRETIALLASFFLAISFWHVNFSRIGFRAIMAPAFLVWALYLFLKSIKSSAAGGYNNWSLVIGYWLLPIIAGTIFGLGFHSYIAYRALPLLFLVFIPFFWHSRRFWAATVALIIGTIITAAPLGLYFLNNPADFFGRTTQVSITASATPWQDLGENIVKTAGMFNFVGDFNWRHNLSGSPQLLWPVGLLFLLGLLISFKNLLPSFIPSLFPSVIPAQAGIQKTKYSHLAPILIFSWLIISSLPVIVSNEGLPHALRAILMIPPVFILAGWGGEFVYYRLTNILPKYRHSLFYVSLVFLAIITLTSYEKYFITWGQNSETAGAFNQNYVELAKEINSLPAETPKYIIVESGGVDVRGLPMPTQTVMFLTDSFLPEGQQAKNIRYLLPSETSQIPPNTHAFKI